MMITMISVHINSEVLKLIWTLIIVIVIIIARSVNEPLDILVWSAVWRAIGGPYYLNQRLHDTVSLTSELKGIFVGFTVFQFGHRHTSQWQLSLRGKSSHKHSK